MAGALPSLHPAAERGGIVTDGLVLDPPSAVAAAKCLISRIWRPGLGNLDPFSFHPRPCAWEDFTRDELSRMLDDFNAETVYDPRRGRYGHVAVDRVRALPHADQVRLVRAAQYPDTEGSAAA